MPQVPLLSVSLFCLLSNLDLDGPLFYDGINLWMENKKIQGKLWIGLQLKVIF